MGNTDSFSGSSTAEECVEGVDLRGKTIVVTGANCGIGKETARVLFRAGATVVMGCRSLERGEAARADIVGDDANGENVSVVQLDLSRILSVDEFASTVARKHARVHCVICNAGIMGLPTFTPTAAGFESQWATNHLGHFALVQQLLPQLRAAVAGAKAAAGGALPPATAPAARVVCVASIGHWFALPRRSADSFPPNPGGSWYSPWPAYGLSKLSNIAHAAELQRRYGGEGIGAVSLHPGVIKTELHRNNMLAKVFYTLGSVTFKSIAQGAATQTLCAVRDDLVGGGFYSNCQHATARPDALSAELGAALWDKSELACTEAREREQQSS